jgi:hypothetical protein
MTCEEYKAVVKNIFYATIAEKAGMVRHGRDCESCLFWLEERFNEDSKKLTPEQITELDELSEKDFQRVVDDPEARKVMFG